MTYFEEYSQYLKELHILIKRGMGDSEYADSLRDKMDFIWFKLTDLEQYETKDLGVRYSEESL